MKKLSIDDNGLKQLSNLDNIESVDQKSAQNITSILLDAINSSINALILTDLNGKICFTNPRFIDMFDFGNQNILGKNAADLFSAREIRNLSDVISLIDISEEKYGEFAVKNSRGEQFHVEITASPITSSAGNYVGRMASFIDVTQKKEIERER